MKKGLILAALLVFLQAIGFAAQGSKAEQEIRKLDEQRIAALTQPDFAELDRLMTDDFTYTHSSGQVQTKAEFLASVHTTNSQEQQVAPESMHLRVFGDVAIASGVMRVKGVLYAPRAVRRHLAL